MTPSNYMGQSVTWQPFWEADRGWYVVLGVKAEDVGVDRDSAQPVAMAVR